MPLLDDLDIDLADESTRAAIALIAVTAVATVAFLWLARVALYPRGQSVIPNPLRTEIPQLSEKEVSRLEYGPNAYPGARDVPTPVCALVDYIRPIPHM